MSHKIGKYQEVYIYNLSTHRQVLAANSFWMDFLIYKMEMIKEDTLLSGYEK